MDNYYLALEQVRKSYAGTEMSDYIYAITRSSYSRDMWGVRIVGLGESLVKIYALADKELDVTESLALNETKRVVAQYA